MTQANRKIDENDSCRTTPLDSATPTVAVIGAGISGLTCARKLADHGLKVTVFEKSQGVGGRMATRRAGDSLSFDHGAQYFTARDSRFKRCVDSWIDDGIAALWSGRIVVLEEGRVKEDQQGTDRFVGFPGMNAICKHLATDIDVRFLTRVMPIQRVRDRWELTDDQGNDVGVFDAVIVAAPAAQTADLLRELPHLANQARRAEMSGCWAIMMALAKPTAARFDAAFLRQSPLSWIARNSSKPGRRAQPETWVLHASPQWSQANMEASPGEIEAGLLAAFWQAIKAPSQEILHSTAHRWRFALPTEPLAESCLFDRQWQVGACGDWCGGPRVEGAYLSGLATAERVLGLLNYANREQNSILAKDDELSD